ncbi:putative UTP--glucose-1-phosphate uridylyltransferase [Fusarium oxysporum f. sp. albedinis]|nr:putative UTP--glucose-1-phosphate uridylyltransferase [Fusarium oxysporum f. sp. albedinis]
MASATPRLNSWPSAAIVLQPGSGHTQPCRLKQDFSLFVVSPSPVLLTLRNAGRVPCGGSQVCQDMRTVHDNSEVLPGSKVLPGQ